MNLDTLHEDAEYGKLPYDNFVCEKWDYSRAPEQDRQEWDDLALKILPTAAQIKRVLLPHQTARERNLSLRTAHARYAPVWLRTCYSPELADTYEDWCSVDLEHVLGHWSQILDDEAVYASCAGDWSRVLLRVPAIADTVRYDPETGSSTQPCEEDFERPGPGEEFKMPVYEAKVKETTLLFLVDEEALRTGLVKILWLDIHGECVWENRLDSHRMLQFRGHMADGGSLADLYEYYEEPEMYEPGAVLEID